ncbi:MAG TPA: GvpL/GvpF family gas vesicle protein [Lamprocystis sp. (in: g-proteobacteria)]|nr:GvpL/GvpF family gas vesicle protein [Lamprocystis sp. (in: g-proteobacteria)]
MSTTPMTRPMLHCILRGSLGAVVLPAGLRRIGVDGLNAVVRDVDPGQVRAADTTLLQGYANLIARIHADATLIPMRFGCVFATDDVVRRLLDGHRSQLLATLDHLDDCVEFGIRLVISTPSQASPLGQRNAGPVPDPGTIGPLDHDRRPGHGHLAAIRQRLSGDARAAERARAARGAIEQAVAGLFRTLREEFGQIGGRYLLSLYFLVPRGDSAHFVERLRSDQSKVPGTGLLTGPWPPYNFVGAIDDDLRSLA